MRLALPLLASLLALGCNAGVESQLRACGLISDGELGRFPLYAPNDCYDQCLGGASCEALEGAFCRTDVQLLIECDRRCAFACDSGALIAVEAVCNGSDDCEGGEDERDCPVYVCDDGEELAGAHHRCDGTTRCRDGSDEAGCPSSEFTCADGSTVDARHRCNGWTACDDGSDEVGCAEVLVECDG